MPFSSWKTAFFAPHQIPPNPTRGVWVGLGPSGPHQPPLKKAMGGGAKDQQQKSRQPLSLSGVFVDPNCQPDSNTTRVASGIRPTQPVSIDRDVDDTQFFRQIDKE